MDLVSTRFLIHRQPAQFVSVLATCGFELIRDSVLRGCAWILDLWRLKHWDYNYVDVEARGTAPARLSGFGTRRSIPERTCENHNGGECPFGYLRKIALARAHSLYPLAAKPKLEQSRSTE